MSAHGAVLRTSIVHIVLLSDAPQCAPHCDVPVRHITKEQQLQAVCCVWVQVFTVARDSGTTYNGLASSCSPVSRLPSVASDCPTTAFVDCYQVTIPSSQATLIHCLC